MDLEVVIKIPEETYNYIKKQVADGIDNPLKVYIAKGILLPKGHGRLGDLDIILNKAMKHRESYMEAENSSYCRGKLHAYELYVEEVENAPTIIEADAPKRTKGTPLEENDSGYNCENWIP